MGEVDKLRIALENFCSTKSDDSLVDDIPGIFFIVEVQQLKFKKLATFEIFAK